MLNDRMGIHSRANSTVNRNGEARPSSASRSSPLQPTNPPSSGNTEKGKLGGIFTGMSSSKNTPLNDKTAFSVTPIPTANTVSNPSQGGIKGSDILKFSEDNFDVELYVRGMLQHLPNEEAIQQLYHSLADAKDLAATDLQCNVYRNYNDFVVISKEISKLESDMLYLRELLTDLKDVQDNLRPVSDPENDTELVQMADDSLASPEQKRAAMAEALAKQRVREEELIESREAQMKLLYTNIDGLQKILPESKQRYLVRDGSKTHYWEVSTTTFKQKDMVHLYLFNDTLVQVSWKKSIITGKARMFAEIAWGLSEIGFIDMKDSPDVSNAFKIVRHPDASIYRTETLEEKRAILASIKRITDDILVQRRKEKDQVKNAAISKANTMTALLPNSNMDQYKNISDQLPVKDNLSATDYRWLLELPDELDVLVAHRDFDNSVANLEKGKLVLNFINTTRKILSGVDIKTPRVQMLRASVENRIEILAKLVTSDLASPVSTKSQVQENIDRLLRLGLGDQARDIFLTARTKTIRHRTRHLKFDGDVAAYMCDLAEVTFRLIRNTCDWYGGSFRDTTMASGFMKWVTLEIVYFTDILRRQVFNSRQSFSVIADCLSSALDQCQQLRDVGLDLGFLIDQIVFGDIEKAIENHSKSLEELVIQAIECDTYESLEPRIDFFEERGLVFDAEIPRMSESAYQLFTILTDFASDVGALMSMTICVVLSNITFVVEQMLPKVKIQLEEQFERVIPELDEDCIRHKASLEKVKTVFVESSCSNLIKNDYNFSKVDYSNLSVGLNKLLMNMDATLDCVLLVGRVIQLLFDKMVNTSAGWETEKGPRKFGFGGVQSLLLDIHFMLRVAETYITEDANKNANSVCEMALRAYFVQNKDLSVPLKTGEWYDKRVDEAVRKFGKNLALLTTGNTMSLNAKAKQSSS
ncbi:hypothetical protein BATDEDRAFT_88866 [Batrachochytrium dendrobatidis JAM81]|uniref:Exocyst complex component EXO84 n=1 Tax=Batrachochytrium dendrobatidis (strain JAM81 / FGSC 10211) TaxID=684364 RepID=F4P2Q9_BATDJ|nr:uncharacterized protein BATDEDRAFT_88866 [Batrachochytrium dendrobatidis JAM81]EGF80061.1 hypothetical protein BATDEDRAFT_88866 [Batrachochytrium dendrobatidis JAM81]|eukprot:XP_006679154.1 hypothetical protein BATDEDRAFT_88866 [Batrachochytrium dendrobatidis JAM81]